MEAAIPGEFGEPYRKALTKLQKDAPRIRCSRYSTDSWAQITFSSFNDTPLASASIRPGAQAIWSDGRSGVKIQYQRRRGAAHEPQDHAAHGRRGKQLSPAPTSRGGRRTGYERTEMELDCRLEPQQRAFAKAYHDHPRFRCLHVVAAAHPGW